jgi:hypothetical protein
MRRLSLVLAGGASELSEALSFELIARCFGPQHAALARTEREVRYDNAHGARTDYVAELFAAPCAVSVTRAYERLGPGEEGTLFELRDAEQARDTMILLVLLPFPLHHLPR